MECEGSCENHEGEVVKVKVKTLKGFDWGEFYYCQNAIKEDRNRGLIVTEVEQE